MISPAMSKKTNGIAKVDKPQELNCAQWEAVTHRNGNLLIVAGPGTGKTHTLTYRILYLAEETQAHTKILAITFTKKAAREMFERLTAKLSAHAKRITVGTFHSFCLQVLRQYRSQAGLPSDFRVATSQEIRALMGQAWTGFSKRQHREVLEQISRWKGTGFEQELPKEAKQYNELLRQESFLDYDDLLLEAYRLLKDNPQVLAEVQEKFRYIFVDEYQDINPIQQALLKLMVGEKNHITAIGDPNQAIYGFRGSDVRFFKSFLRDYPPAETVFLSENYRAAQDLLSACGQVMSANINLHVPELTARIYKKGRLTIYEAPTDRAEAEYVVHQIEKIVGGTSMFSQDSKRVDTADEGTSSFGDIAVFYRLKSQYRLLAEAFDRSGIPYKAYGMDEDNREDVTDDFYFDRVDDFEIEHEKVSLMTLHTSKGLEFPVVFMVGCEEKLLPLNLKGFASNEEEERRLFYVGMTRAKERLYLTSAKKRHLYGETLENAASRFVSSIQDELKTIEKPERRLRDKDKKTDPQLDLFKT